MIKVKAKSDLIMKFFILIVCVLLGTSDLIGQKHQFGALAGAQIQAVSGIGIDSNDERLYFNADTPIQSHYGLYYRHQLDKWISLEAVPVFFTESISAQYINPTSSFTYRKESIIQTANIYMPVLLRLDLGHKISFTAGGGPILFLNKKKTDSINLSNEESEIFEDLLRNHNNWPINGSLGLSYGIGRFSINGKYVFRATEVFDEIKIKEQSYPIDFRMDAFYLDLSYRIF